MATRPSSESKELATRLANMLALQNIDEQAARGMLEELGYAPAARQAPSAGGKQASGENIGIYKRELIDNEVFYTRDVDAKAHWSFFADVQRIPPKSKKKRIVFLGESVARGFLLDPGYTPAGVLGTLLNSNDAKEEYEVIDLAETNLGMAGLKQRYGECMALEPDMVVFLAGNNWRSDLEDLIVSDPEHYQEFLVLIEGKAGIGAFKAVFERLFRTMIRSFMSYVREQAALHHTATLFVIPEFNLLDCRSTPGERFISRLPDGATRKWVLARDQAEKAFGKDDLDTCAVNAATMTELDPSHPLGYELLADCMLRREEYERARDYLEVARDTALFCRTNSKPRVFRVIRETILSEAGDYGLQVVDLPAIFKEHLNGKVPGRDLFLDYCHFTVEGIQTAMHAVARQVLAHFQGGAVGMTVQPGTIRPDKELHALAHLFAAIHNAHWGQKYEILEYHCTKALRHHNSVMKTMIYYCDMMSRITSNNLCKTFELLVSDSRLDRYVHALMHPRGSKSMELDLVSAMIHALTPAGVNLGLFVDDIRAKDHEAMRHKVNLLRSFYHLTSYDEYQGTKAAFFQARDTESVFFLVSKDRLSFTFELSLRTPEAGDGEVNVSLVMNDTPVTQIAVSNKWSDHTIIVPGEVCEKGVNRVKLVWPIPEHAQGQGEHSRKRNSSSILDAAYCVFGEIAIFTAIEGEGGHLCAE